MTRAEIQDLIDAQTAIILSNQDKLSSEDYKIIKCAEAKVKDLPMPYDINELITRRNNYRNMINSAQEKIIRLKSIDIEDTTSID